MILIENMRGSKNDKKMEIWQPFIKPDYVLTPEGWPEKGWGVRIEEGRIACVGPWDTLGSGSNEEAQTVCLPGQMLLPGFVNGHNHMYGVLSHGITAEAMVTDFLRLSGGFLVALRGGQEWTMTWRVSPPGGPAWR